MTNTGAGGRVDTVVSRFGKDAYHDLPELCAEHLGGGPYLVVSDERIWAAAGDALRPALARLHDPGLHLLPGDPAPYASEELVAKVRELLERGGAKGLAFGSGTINDVVKRASFELARPYICLPTAPSVDGFTAYGAAITVGGFKMTLECPAPPCVLADEDVVSSAPAELIAAGYGDLVAKLTGGADWIVADAAGVEPVVPEILDMVQPNAHAILDRAEDLVRRDRAAVGLLFDGLARSGIAMQRYRDSRPASGTEHLLSHTWEMSHIEPECRAGSHGFKVAVGTLIASAFFTELFSPEGAAAQTLGRRKFRPAERLGERRVDAARRLLEGHPALGMTLDSIRKKTPSGDLLAARCARMQERWDGLRTPLARRLPSFGRLKERLAAGGCPVEPAALGLDRARCLQTLELASLIRTRYTVLDLASELGVFEVCAEAVFSSGYFTDYAPAR